LRIAHQHLGVFLTCISTELGIGKYVMSMKPLSKFFLAVLLLTVASVSWAACPFH